jgi:FKBP-type peptidyl-prolyl cis-trans isomerase FkpA
MKSNVLLLVLAAAVAFAGCGSGSTPPAGEVKGAEPKTEQEKTLYALGLLIGGNLTSFSLTPEELELVKKGLGDAATGASPLVDLQAYAQKVQELASSRGMAAAEAEKKRSADFIEKAASEPGARKTASGLVYRTVKAGTGASPAATDTVSVHYQGLLADGTVFDSSIQRGQPAEFPLNQVIPCWSEGVQMMKVGEKANLACPSTLAYGDRGSPPRIPGGAALFFEVELLDIVKK